MFNKIKNGLKFNYYMLKANTEYKKHTPESYVNSLYYGLKAGAVYDDEKTYNYIRDKLIQLNKDYGI